MKTKTLTVELIEAAKPSAAEYEIRDLRVPKLVLVVGRQKKSFKFVSRIPGETSTRFFLGEYPRGATRDQAVQALADARQLAELWTTQISLGLNPIREAEQKQIREALVGRATFRSVFGDFLLTLPHRDNNRTAHKDIRMLERELLDAERNPFVDKPIDKVTYRDIEELLHAIRDRPSKSTARRTFWQLNCFYRWIRTDIKRCELYGVQLNLRDRIDPKKLVSKSGPRDRHFSTAELRCLWRVINKLVYPMGPYYGMLLITGQRKSDVARAQWSEIDLVNGTWIIPANRYKTGSMQIVALPPLVIQLLKDLRSARGNRGDFVFSFNGGLTPINGFSKAVNRLRKQFAEEFARENPGIPLPHWVLHDKRRTVRTQLAALKVPRDIAKLIMGHEKTGMDKVYDQYAYLSEMRDALDRWSRHLVALGEAPICRWLDLEPNRTLLPE